MKSLMKLFYFLILFCCAYEARAQKVDSIYFNLYTDSLKKGTYNYINVEGKLSDGRIVPLTPARSSSTVRWANFQPIGLLDPDMKAEKIEVTAVLRANPKIKAQSQSMKKKKIWSQGQNN
jgi:hypothetical protein